MIGKLLPTSLKARIRFIQRNLNDQASGIKKLMASKSIKNLNIPTGSIKLTQPLLPGTTFNQKVNNIKIGANWINEVTMKPGEIFSFWAIVPRPTKKNGFVKSRNLVNGQISSAVGGGICQLASITYHAALLADLDILERHNHSLDIYEEHDRFTPLGADAAVVWGHKDLRFKNKSSENLWFQISFEGNEITLELCSSGLININKVDFLRAPDTKAKRTVDTYVNGKLANTSVYQLPTKA